MSMFGKDYNLNDHIDPAAQYIAERNRQEVLRDMASQIRARDAAEFGRNTPYTLEEIRSKATLKVFVCVFFFFLVNIFFYLGKLSNAGLAGTVTIAALIASGFFALCLRIYAERISDYREYTYHKVHFMIGPFLVALGMAIYILPLFLSPKIISIGIMVWIAFYICRGALRFISRIVDRS